MQTKIQAEQRQIDEIKKIVAECISVSYELSVFGSRAKGRARADSDLDLMIKAAHPIPLASMGKLRASFEDSSIPYKIDLMDFHALDKDFMELVSNESVSLVAS